MRNTPVTPLPWARLPRPLRMWAARRAVRRLKHGSGPSGELASPLSCLLALLLAAALGHALGEARARSARFGEAPAMDTLPARAAGHAPGRAVGDPGEPAAARGTARGRIERDGASGAGATGQHDLVSEIGRLSAEILRLRVLFRRLADVAELDGGEFDLELEPIELPEVRRALSAREALDLSFRALDPISRQSGRMASIFDERRAAHDRRVGGRVAPGAARSSGFGYRPGPFGGQRRLHRGVDFAGRPGTPILALADGVVAFSGANGGYGNLVEIEHVDGFRTRYAHNERNLVAPGQRVAKGEQVATLGSSGRSTGPHVHVEVRRHGAPLDPAAFVR